MTNPVITPLSGDLAPVNAQLEKIANSLKTKLDRIPDEGEPNQMQTNLDMNSQRVLNLPKPVNGNEPLRLQDLNDFMLTSGFINEYNAILLGVPNDGSPASEAINGAIGTVAASGGGTLYFPTGSYLVDDQILLQSKVSLRGSNEGSVFTAKNQLNQDMFYGIGIENVNLDNLTVDGNGSNQTPPANIAGGQGVSIQDSSYINIRNCHIRNCTTTNLSLSESSVGCEHINITGNIFEDNLTRYSMFVDRSSNIRINNNQVINPAQSGIQVFLCSNTVITGNVVEHTGLHNEGFGGIRITATAGINDNVSVVGNTVRGTSRGIFVGDNTSSITVTGNTVDNIGRDGIFLDSDSNDNIISSNVIRNLSGEAANTWSGITADACNNNVISDNKIIDTNGVPNMKYAIDTGNLAENNVVTGNYFTSGLSGDCLSSPRNYYRDNFSFNQRDSIPSASTVLIPFGGDIYNVTGSSDIDNINIGTDGREITLVFGGGGVTVRDGTGNLRLNGDFVTNNQDTLTLKYFSGATAWFEVSRSPN